MRSIRLGGDLVPVNELRSKLAEWLEHLETTGRPVVVTQRGRAAAVMLRPEDVDELEEQRELVHKVLRGLRESSNSDTVDDDEVWAQVDALLAKSGTGE